MESNAHVCISTADNTVTIRIVGSMDLRLYDILHELAHKHRNNQGMRYVFDWSQANCLHDSGVATLISFQKWITDQKAIIEFANCGSHILNSFLRSGTLEHFIPASDAASEFTNI
jgi:anti-anti-sigma regulatory factor